MDITNKNKNKNKQEKDKNEPHYWFLAATKPKQEFKAVEHLSNQNISAYCPTIKIEKIVKNKKQTVKEVIFRGYVFIQLATDDSNWHKVRSTRGIRDWIRFSGKVAKIPTPLVNELKTAESFENILVLNKMDSGDKVRILSGPFEGLEGIFQKDDGELRALILLSFLGKSNQISLDKSLLSAD